MTTKNTTFQKIFNMYKAIVDSTGNITGPAATLQNHFETGGTFTAQTGGGPTTVAEPAVNANSAIVITLKTVGGTVGSPPIIKTITPGTGFTVTNTSSDTSVYNYLVIG